MTTTASFLMEEGKQKSDFDIASKNVGSFVKINAISIDLADANDKSCEGKCDHFSIRGYVSEVRKKNWKLCWPFALDDEQIKSKEQTSLLPPLTSPKFRYWSCKCCLQESGCTGTEKDNATRSSNCSAVSKSKSDCCHIPTPCSRVMHLPDAQQVPKSNLTENRQYDVCTSTDVNLKIISYKATGNGSGKDTGHELAGVTSVPVEINLNVMQEKPDHNDTESRKLEEIRRMGLFKDGRGKYDVTEVVRVNPMGTCENSSKVCVLGNPISVDGQLDKLNVASGSSTLASAIDGAANSVKKSTNGSVSGLLDERDRASSGSAEIVGSRVHDSKSSSPSGPQRRKARKVRLLTDLLERGEAKTEQVSKDNSPSSVVDGESSGAGLISAPAPAPQGQSSFPDNRKEDDSEDSKKRKLPRDDVWRPSEINLNKKVKSSKESEVNDTPVLPGSEIKADASIGLYPQTNRKTHRGKHGADKLPIAEKKKNKKSQVSDVHSYLVPIGEHFTKQVQDEVVISNKGTVKDGVSFRAVNEASTSRGVDRVPLTSPKTEKKPSLSKNKMKMPQLDDGHSSKYHWNNAGFQRNGPIRNEDIMQSGSFTVPFRHAEEAAIDTGLQLSIGGSAAPRKCNRKYNPQVVDGISPLSWQEGTPVDQTKKKIVERNYVSESTIPSRSGSYPLYKKQVHGDVNGQLNTYTVPVLNEKQNGKSQTEGRRSLGKQVDTSGASNSLKTTKLKENSSGTRKGIVEIADKVSDKGAVEEFPMEIVELLARIQYEKGLPIPQNSKSLLKAANEGRKSAMLDYEKVYSADKFRAPGETSKRTNSQAPKNFRNGQTAGRKNAKPTKQKSVEHFPNFNGDHVNGSHLVQKKTLGGIQLSASRPIECSCAQNCQWNTSMLGHGFLNASIQRGSCETCPDVPRPTEEPPQTWPSAIPLERPIRYNNVPPQKAIPLRSSLQMAPNTPGLQHHINRNQELKYSKHYATNLEFHGQQVVSETFSRRSSEYTYVNSKHNGVEHQQNLRGSMDMYTNETIPAMHLLSLVTAGMSSGPSFNASENARDCPDNISKGYPQMVVGVYNKPKDATKHSLDYHGKNQLSVKPHDFFPVNPMAGPSTSSSFRHEKGFERANDFMEHVSFSSRGKEKVQKSAAAPAQSRGKALNSAFASGSYGPVHTAIPVHRVQKSFFGASSSTMPPLQPFAPEYPTELKLGTPHSTGAFRPMKSRTEFMICSVNRNPADFSVPGAGNEYMIRGEDLKIGKSRKKRNSNTADQQRKPQKQAKRAAETENA